MVWVSFWNLSGRETNAWGDHVHYYYRKSFSYGINQASRWHVLSIQGTSQLLPTILWKKEPLPKNFSNHIPFYFAYGKRHTKTFNWKRQQKIYRAANNRRTSQDASFQRDEEKTNVFFLGTKLIQQWNIRTNQSCRYYYPWCVAKVKYMYIGPLSAPFCLVFQIEDRWYIIWLIDAYYGIWVNFC